MAHDAPGGIALFMKAQHERPLFTSPLHFLFDEAMDELHWSEAPEKPAKQSMLACFAQIDCRIDHFHR